MTAATAMRNDRTDKVALEALASNPRIKLIDISVPGNTDWVAAVAPAFIAGVFAFFAGVGVAQWAAVENARILWMVFSPENQVKASLAVGGCWGTIAFILLYIFERRVDGVRYFADFIDVEEEQETPPDSFIETARQNERKRLTGNMRTLLEIFARYYETVGTVAVIAWYESRYLNRKQIEEVRAYLVLIGAANETVRSGRTYIELSEWGKEQIVKWRNADFGDVIELTANSPAPEQP